MLPTHTHTDSKASCLPRTRASLLVCVCRRSRICVACDAFELVVSLRVPAMRESRSISLSLLSRSPALSCVTRNVPYNNNNDKQLNSSGSSCFCCFRHSISMFLWAWQHVYTHTHTPIIHKHLINDSGHTYAAGARARRTLSHLAAAAAAAATATPAATALPTEHS